MAGAVRVRATAVVAAVLLATATSLAATASSVDLTDLSLEQLADLEVTSVSKKEERLFDAASAVTVVTADDIRRSGATSLPEALRLVPGVQVARIDATHYAISARGFNEEFSNKLLVLIDGRTVYTPLFAGVFWDEQSVMLEDVDRIEVIRGPGATLWGANAVNGVINVITRSAADTPGGLVTAGGGTIDRALGGARWGGAIGTTLHYRGYAQYRDGAALERRDGRGAGDAWRAAQGGFRLDWRPQDADVVTLQGDLRRADEHTGFRGPRYTPPFHARTHPIEARLNGGNVLGRWTHTLSPGSDVSLQAYYDRAVRREEFFGLHVDTFDVEAQHRLQLAGWNELTWGLGFRHQSDAFEGVRYVVMEPARRSYALYSGFLQDDVQLVRDRLRLTLGTKLEHNDFSGFEVQPSARLTWTPQARHAVWTSVSRAVRSPSRVDQDGRLKVFTEGILDGKFPALPAVMGGEGVRSEVLLAYELGYRVQPLDTLSADLAAFYNDYDDLLSTRLGGDPFIGQRPRPHVVAPIEFANAGRGEAYGLETTLTWHPLSRWKLSMAHTMLHVHLEHDGVALRDGAGNAPAHQLTARSSLNLPWNLEADTLLYYVGALNGQSVPSYVRLDLRLGWRPIPSLELSVVGQNLAQDRHLEFRNVYGITQPSEIPRSVHGKVTWRF